MSVESGEPKERNKETGSSRRILFLGSGGRLGRLLQSAAPYVVPLDIETVFQSRQIGSNIRWEPGMPLSALPPSEIVVGLWGVTSGGAKQLGANTNLSDLTARVAESVGARAAVHLSSSAVYGPGINLCETSICHPVSAYGHAKKEMEEHIRARQAQSNFSHRIFRLANVLGADSLAPALQSDAPAILDRFADGGGPRRSYITAPDLLRILCQMMRGLPDAGPAEHWPEPMNVASPKAVDMADLVRASGQDIQWRSAPPHAVPEVSLNTERLSATFPALKLRETAQEMIEDWRFHRNRE